MVDFNSLISACDNLFKFLFVGGIVLVFFSVSYPLQKKQGLEIEINAHNQQAALLNSEISDVSSKVRSLQKLKAKVDSEIITLDKQIANAAETQKRTIDSLQSKIRADYSIKYNSIEKERQQLVTKNIIVKFNKDKIKILQGHVDTYDSYAFWLTLVGSIIGLGGLIGWTYCTLKPLWP